MKILNIGSLNIDRTYTVEHLVRPKETANAIRYEEFCGGKGLNQSVALSKAGAEVYHAGAVGKDGKNLLEVLANAGVSTHHIKMISGVSGHAVIQVDQRGQNSIIIHSGANGMISRQEIDRVLDSFTRDDMVLLQNEIANVDYCIEAAKRKGMKIAFNPSPINAAVDQCRLDAVDYFLVNEIEGAVLAGVDDEEPERMISILKDKYPNASFVLTLGEKGSCFFNRDVVLYQNSFFVEAVDTTGAGDTFSGYFLSGIAKGMEEKDILRRASAASAISVGRKGASQSIPDSKEVEAFLKRNPEGTNWKVIKSQGL
ncbi:ribokinase [Lachnospiraceae bacterium 54-53]